jgi:nucleoside-diphosphate-sugar epimerase
MQENAVIFGGSGFIGMHLLRLLKKENLFSSVTSVDLAEPSEKLPGVHYEIFDIRKVIPNHFANEASVIFNLTALRTFPGHSDEEYFATNLGTTERILELARSAGSKKIVFTSTMSVYATGEEPKTEASPLSPSNAYGQSKVKAEELHQAWLSESNSRNLVICRPAVIFGYRDNGNFTRLANALRQKYFVYVGRKDTIKSAGYVGDLAATFLFALAKKQSEIIYNFAYPERLTIANIVETFCEVGSFAKPMGTLPAKLLEAAAIPFEVLNAVGIKNPIHRKRIAKLHESTNIMPAWLMENGFTFQTTLKSAIQEWKSESPGGRFI